METIPVIILNWNGFNDTVECVESVLKQSYQGFRIVLADNNSANGEFEQLLRRYGNHPKIELIRNTSNLGFTLAHNQLFASILKTTAPYVALINNDAVADRHWLECMVATAHEQQAHMVASLMLNYFEPEKIDSAGLFMLSSGEILPLHNGHIASQLPSTDKLIAASGGACLYSTSLLREIGLFDTYFDTGYEDAELGLRAFMAGKKIVLAQKALVYHKVSQSVAKVYNRAKAVKVQSDINYTRIKLLPTTAIAFNAFFNVPRAIIILIVHLLTFRFRFVGIQTEATWKTFKEMPFILKQRAKFRKYRVQNGGKVLQSQVFFMKYDYFRFRRLILKRNKNQFEKF